MTQPSLGDFYELSPENIRTGWLKSQAFKFITEPGRVTHLPEESTKTTKVYRVVGDHGTYRVWLRPFASLGKPPAAAAASTTASARARRAPMGWRRRSPGSSSGRR